MVIMGPLLTLISIVNPQRGVGSHVEKGWDPSGPTASHRTRFGIHVEKSRTTGSHRAQFGSHRREELGPTGSHQVRIRTRARLVVLGYDFGSRKCSCFRLQHSMLHSII